MARRQIARGDDLLRHFLERLHLGRIDTLDAVAERNPRALEIAHHPPHPAARAREGLLAAFPGTIKREVLLHHAGAKDEGDERTRDAVVGGGKPDQDRTSPRLTPSPPS